jgi:hypothetical protein
MSSELLEKSITLESALASVRSFSPPPYQVQVIRSLQDFTPLRAEWDAFLKDTGTQNLCMTHGSITG